MKINTKKYRGFVFDGCHKFYLIGKKTKNKVLEDSNWESKEIRPIAELTTELWQSSCPLRFIQEFENFKDIINQGSRIKKIKLI